MMNNISTSGSSLDSSSLYSAEEVGSNGDLIRLIFLYLPVRSLIRFKLVSKPWSSLISDPQFARDHTHRLNPNSVIPSGLFFYNSLAKSEEIESVSLDDSRTEHSRVRVPSLSFLNTVAVGGSKIKILQSCNGLLLCKFKSEFGNEYCVCNPTTKKSKILPQVILYPEEEASGFTLAFDPSASPHYKVICVVPERNMQMIIYLSETGKWHTLEYSCNTFFWLSKFSTGIYWNGLIHWIGLRMHLKYDLEKNIFKVCALPVASHSISSPTLWYFGESKGCLHLVYVRKLLSNELQVLERERDSEMVGKVPCSYDTLVIPVSRNMRGIEQR